MATEGTTSPGWWGRILNKLGIGHMPLGRRGEKYAAKYLKQHGFRIIARNRMLGSALAAGWTIRPGKGEIDLIGIEGNFLVFVEVRTRASEAFMKPEESIRFKKRKIVVRTVRRLIHKRTLSGLTPRIDVVAIIWPTGAKEPTDLRHHRGVMAVTGW